MNYPMQGFAGAVPGAQTMTPGLQPPQAGPDAGVRVPPGALIQYYSDLSSGMLPPEDMRIEDLQFRVQIDPNGNITSNSDKVTLLSRYNFAFRRVTGFIMDPDLSGAAPMLVNFQIQEQGRDFTIFKRPVSMQSLLSRSGSGNIAEWDGVYITVPGTDLSVEWTVDTARWAALVGATKEMGVQLLGDYVVCRGNF
jgi:hypothetical protein